MSQDGSSDSSPEREYYDVKNDGDDVMPTEERSEPCGLDESNTSQTSGGGLDSSFVGRVRSNVSSFISKLFPTRSGSEKSSSPFKLARRQPASGSRSDAASDANGAGPSEQRKRRHSPNMEDSPVNAGNIYDAVIKRRRLLSDDIIRIVRNRPSAPSAYNDSKRIHQRQSLPGRFRSGLRYQPSASSIDTVLNQRPLAFVGDAAGGAMFRSSVEPERSVFHHVTEFDRQSDDDDDTSTDVSDQQVAVDDPGKVVSEQRQEQPPQHQSTEEDNHSTQSSTSSVFDPYQFLPTFNTSANAHRRQTTFLGNQHYRNQRVGRAVSDLCFSSHLERNKSLFSRQNDSSTSSSRRPSFNSLLYSSTSSLSSVRRQPNYSGESRFYDGPTRYGGASASTHPYRNRSISNVCATISFKRQTAGERIEAPAAPTVSYATQRILDILDNYSKAEKDSLGQVVNKSGMGAEDQRRELDAIDARCARRPPRPYAPALLNRTGLQIPTVPHMLQMKRMLLTTENSRRIAEQDTSNSILSQPFDYVPPVPVQVPDDTGVVNAVEPNHDVENDNGTGAAGSVYSLPEHIDQQDRGAGGSYKQMNKKMRVHAESIREPARPALPVELPDVPLPKLAAMPKFDLVVMAQRPSAVTPPQVIAEPAEPERERIDEGAFEVATVNETIYTFGQPSPPLFDLDLPLAQSIIQFDSETAFAEPEEISIVDYFDTDEDDDDSDGDEDDDSDADENDDVDAGEEDNNVGDVCKNGNGKGDLPSFAGLIAEMAKKWFCDVCMVPNDPSVSKCVACETVRPAAAATTNPATSMKPAEPQQPSENFSFIIASQASRWQCSTCSVYNEKQSTVCVCCGAQPPSTAYTSSNTAVSMSGKKNERAAVLSGTQGVTWSNTLQGDKVNATNATEGLKPKTADMVRQSDSFKKLAATQMASTWTCGTCLTANGLNQAQCLCCEQLRPMGSPAEASKSALHPVLIEDNVSKEIISQSILNPPVVAAVGRTLTLPTVMSFETTSLDDHITPSMAVPPFSQRSGTPPSQVPSVVRNVTRASTSSTNTLIAMYTESSPVLSDLVPVESWPEPEAAVKPSSPSASSNGSFGLNGKPMGSPVVKIDAPMELGADASPSTRSTSTSSSMSVGGSIVSINQQSQANTSTSTSLAEATGSNGPPFDGFPAANVAYTFGRVQVPSGLTAVPTDSKPPEQMFAESFFSGANTVPFTFGRTTAATSLADTKDIVGVTSNDADRGAFVDSGSDLFAFGTNSGHEATFQNPFTNNNSTTVKPFSFTPNATPLFNFTNNVSTISNAPAAAQPTAPVFQFGGPLPQQTSKVCAAEFGEPNQAQQLQRRTKLRATRRLQRR